MLSLRRMVARDDVVLGLRDLASAAEAGFHRAELEDRLMALGIEVPSKLLDSLLDSGLVAPLGDRFGISSLGQRTALLADALDGGDLEDIAQRLRRLSGRPEMYELVREGMTGTFVRSLVERPGFRRLYLCSPWMNPSDKDVAQLKYAYFNAMTQQEDSPEVLAIVRPPERAPEGSESGIGFLREIGAQVFFNAKLHSKLYIREPDRHGGVSLAILGSQNLTRSSYLELGIRINGDTRLVDKLIQYFFDVASRSTEVDLGEE